MLEYFSELGRSCIILRELGSSSKKFREHMKIFEGSWGDLDIISGSNGALIRPPSPGRASFLAGKLIRCKFGNGAV